MTGGKQNRKRSSRARERRISVRAVRRENIDLRKLGRALLAIAQAEAAAQADAQTREATEVGSEDEHVPER
jgi:hypothetical protein